MDVEDVPVTYTGIIGRNDFETRKMEFIKVDGTTKVKLEFPIYDDQPNMEILLKLIKSFKKTVDAYDWFTLLGEAEVYDRFKHCLDGDAYDTWDSIVIDEDQAHWDENLCDFMDTLIDDEAYAFQKEYLCDTAKPNGMSTRSWVLRMKAINAYLPTLGLRNGFAAFTELELVRIISRNIPSAWKSRFRLVDGHQATTTATALKKLILLEREEKRTQTQRLRGSGPSDKNNKKKNRRKKGNGSNDDDGDDDKPRNPCKLPGHEGHDYKDCIYNPKSKNYKGVTRTLKDYDSNGKLKKEVKEKEQNYRAEKEKEKTEEAYFLDSVLTLLRNAT